MPIRKRKFAPKRKMIRRKRWGRKTALVNHALQPIPQRYIVKQKYSTVVTTDILSGAYAMNLNSVYDPDRTGIGHQPYGFDTLASLYNRYRVIACGYRLQVTPVTGGSPITLTGMPANLPVIASTSSEIRENPRAKYVVQNFGAPAQVLKSKCYIPSLVGRSKAQYMADDRYQALVTTNPNEEAVLNIQTFNPTTDLPISVPVQILMEYTVEFFDVKSLGQS